MTLGISFGISFVLLVHTLVAVEGRAADWLANLEQRRTRIQSDVDLLIKYFCSYDQRDVNCQVRLPQLREELRQIDEQLTNYRNEEIQRTSYQQPQLQQVAPTQTSAVDLIRRRKFVPAERNILDRRLSDDEVQNVVQEAYDNHVENFKLLVDFATAVRDIELKFEIYKHLLEEIIRRGQDEPLKIIRIIRGVHDEVVQGNSVNDETHNLATNMVDNLKILFETGVAKLWIDNTINQSFERDMNVHQLADEISSLDDDLFTQIITKVIVATYPLTDKHQLMRNMEKFHLVPQLIDAFNVIYNEMAKANDINGKTYILKLGYYCRELMVRSNLTDLSPEKKTQLLTLEQRLPVSIRSLVFNERVCLKSKYSHDYLHIAHGHPKLRRYAIMAPGTQLRWIPKPMNYTTYFEFPYGGYLFADDVNPDGRSRLVAASQASDDIAVGSEWEIEPVGDDCLIRNSVYNELLYVGDEFDRDHLSNRVFTMQLSNVISAGNDDQFKWTIEGC